MYVITLSVCYAICALFLLLWRWDHRRLNTVVDRQWAVIARSRKRCTEEQQARREIDREHDKEAKAWRDKTEATSKQVKACRNEASGLIDSIKRIQAIAAEATGEDDWSLPITEGEPGEDPLCVEISRCGPKRVAVYVARRPPHAHVDYEISMTTHLVCFRHGKRVLLNAFGGEGLASAGDVEQITDAVRRYNQSYHTSKGVEDVGAIEKDGRGDRDRQRDHDQGARDMREQGPSRCASPRERTGSSS